LTVVELRHALAFQPGHGHIDSDSLIDEEIMHFVCAGTVTVEDESHLIRFIHYTTQEYLERIRDTRFPSAISQGGDMSLDEVKEKYFGTAKALREDRLARLNFFWQGLHPFREIIYITFEWYLGKDEDGDHTDLCFKVVSRDLMKIARAIQKNRSSWCVISYQSYVHFVLSAHAWEL
jgi:hypothetical protein